MAKQGVDDDEEWVQLRQVRLMIDNFAQEKLMLIAKLYNLSQKFVQELDLATEETSKQLAQSTSSGRGAASYHDMDRMVMRDNLNHTQAKAFDAVDLEPKSSTHSKNFGKDMMNMQSQASTAKGQKKQRRANDGKFESIRMSSIYDGGKAEGRAGMESKRGRKAGGVEAAFYNNTHTPMEEDKTPDQWPIENESAVVIPSFTPEGDAFQADETNCKKCN